MKRILMAGLGALILTGCASTKSVITEYDASGKITKKTETTESIVKEVTASTKDKTVIAWESGWAAYISASTATQSDPTPTGKMFVGKTDKGVISLHKDQMNLDKVPEIINATKYELTVTKDGVSSSSAKGSAAEAGK